MGAAKVATLFRRPVAMRGADFPLADRPAMNMPLLTVIGFAAAFCTTAAYVPQVWRIWRTRSTQDISLGMFAVMTLGVILWLIYGIMLNSAPVIAANGTTLVLAATILVLKLRGG